MENFASLNLKPEVLKALGEMGIVQPTPIQKEALPLVLSGEDVIGQAQTGTGKTAVFGIHLVESINPSSKVTQALILSPTRELAVQISEEIKRIGKYMRGRILPVYGGTSINNQIDELERGVQIVVGTPGRILDHLERGTLKLGNVSCVVIDEADRMLDMGFIDDVREILSHVPKERQTMLFSATIPEEILALSEDYQKHPHYVCVSKDEITITHIKHTFCQVDFRDRYRALFAYLKHANPTHTIIFCRTKFIVERLANDLVRGGLRAEPLHGGLTQRKRDFVMQKFKRGVINFMVATDLAARGLDVKHISHVINFNLPEEALTYTHRVGRTGRVGREGTAGGTAFSIVANDELGLLGNIERECGITMVEEKMNFASRPRFDGPPSMHFGASREHAREHKSERHDAKPSHRFGHRQSSSRNQRSSGRREHSGRRFESSSSEDTPHFGGKR
ncbi:MAG: DEAD/DEAH box helicase [Candidatus Micrarchaeota archaeon]|nr:DEAD/DEAH box helicase [Candidatus Micrarchaeota archaeon]